MKNVLSIALISFTIAGCGGSSSASPKTVNEAGIPAAIIGSWEIESMSMNGYSMKPDRPNPKDPFRERNTSDWTQLKIDADTLTLISTDFVFYSAPQLPYKVEGKKIVTIDEPNFTLTDFIVHGYTSNSLTLQFVYERENSNGMLWVFKRINENSLATKTAQSVSFKSSVVAEGEQAGRPKLAINKPSIGEVDYSQKGLHDSVSCSINNDDNLQFYYNVLEVKDGSVGSSSSYDGVSYEFVKLPLDLKGPQKSVTSKTGAKTVIRSSGKFLARDFATCEHKVVRNGAVLKINSTCSDDDGKTKATLDATCLLQHSMW